MTLRLSTTLLFPAVVGLAAACTGVRDPLPDPHAHLTPFLEPRLDWLGVYMSGRKVGWARIASAVEDGADGPELVRRSTFAFQASVEGVPIETTTDVEEHFQAYPPWQLVRSRSVLRRRGATEITDVRRDGRDIVVVVDRDGVTFERRREGLDYGLFDALAKELFVADHPPPGEIRKLRVLDTDTLAIARETLHVVAVRHDASGEPVWELEREARDGARELELVDATGRTISWSLGAMELRREPAEVATETPEPVDLGRLGRATVDRPLGDFDTVDRLVLRAEGPGVRWLVDAPGQHIEPLANGAVRVVLEAGGSAPAAPDEVAEARHETLRHPFRTPEIAALAAEATAGATTARERVERLAKFVAAFVEDDPAHADQPSVHHVLRSRAGDCSDHALLFATLARAADVPARVVQGLMYLGDEEQAFGPHEWCEVALDGAWIAVDPTFARFPADAARLRFAPDAATGGVGADVVLSVLEAEPR